MDNKVLIISVITTIILFIYFNNKCQHTGEIYYKNRINKRKINPKVYDISHRYLPDYSKYKKIHIGDLYLFLATLIPFLFTKTSKPFVSFLSYYLLIILIRCITINLTILPKNRSDEYIKYDIINGCYDKIFSGHFATLLLATLIFYKYNIIKNISILIILNIINVLIILCTRSHYSIDIFVSFVVTMLLFTNNINLEYIKI